LKDISPVDILVTDEPAPSFGNFYRMKELTARPGGVQGYFPQVVTVFGIVTDPLCEPITEELGMTIDDLKVIIVTETHFYLMDQRKNAPWGPTWMGLVEYAKKNPGKLRYISHEVGSGHDIACEWIMQHFGIRDYIKKIPQGQHTEVAATIGAGQGDFTLASPGVAFTFWEAGKLDITMTMGPVVPPPFDKNPNVVTAQSLGFPAVPIGIIQSFGVQKSVPDTHVWWLYELLAKASEHPNVKARPKQIPGCVQYVMNPTEGNKLKYDLYEYSEPIIRKIGLHIDQQ
jgi:tripartite-type tricarboxylate transporter receptor subunit TctC